jgi:hypothetical protein
MAVVTCPTCKGSGKCARCGGVGKLGPFPKIGDPCPLCGNKKVCITCGGKGKVRKSVF